MEELGRMLVRSGLQHLIRDDEFPNQQPPICSNQVSYVFEAECNREGLNYKVQLKPAEVYGLFFIWGWP